MWDSCKGASNKDSGDGLLLNKIKALRVQLAVEKRNARKWSVVVSLLKFVFFVVVFLCVICIEFDTFGKKVLLGWLLNFLNLFVSLSYSVWRSSCCCINY
ncbi:hypothetical protein ABFS83_02G033200 [Erythranthe nasuta]